MTKHNVTKGIFGIGNSYREDDGIGLEILKFLKEGDEIANSYLIGVGIDIFRVESHFDEYPDMKDVLFIDAMISEKHKEGTILVFDLESINEKDEKFATISHSISIIDYLKMLKNLKSQKLPEKIQFLGIIIENIGYSEQPTDKIKETIPKVDELIKKWLKDESIIGIH